MKKEICQETAKKMGNMMASANKIAIISHKGPDGDTIGAGLGLYNILLDRGKKVDIACVDEIPTAFTYMKNYTAYQKNLPWSDYDLIITVDVATKFQTGLDKSNPEIFAWQVPLLNIDHHFSNEMFGSLNLVLGEGCSTTAVLFDMFSLLGWDISADAATCLLTGLMTDTGSFQHSNTSPKALKTGAALLRAEADLAKISKKIWHTTPVSTLKLWGKILRRTELTRENITVSSVFERDLEKTGAQYKDIAGVVDYLNMVPEARYCMLLSERDGLVKGSLRTQRDDVNLSDVAGHFGGGGHKKAAGFSQKGKLIVEKRFHILTSHEEKPSHKLVKTEDKISI